MYQETSVPIKKQGDYFGQESEDNSARKENIELDHLFEKELLPLIKIFLPSGEDLDSFVADVATELKNQVEKIQDIENRALISPEDSIKEMRAILIKKAKAFISDYDRQDWEARQKAGAGSIDFYKKAKICLLSAGDFSHWNKYFANEPTKDGRPEFDNISDDNFGYYFGINHSFHARKDSIRLNSLETEALLEAGFEMPLIQFAAKRTSDSFSEINDTLFHRMLKSLEEKSLGSIDFETCLKRIPPPGGYSFQTMESLVRQNYGGYVCDFPKSFADSNKPEFWEKFNILNQPHYPYHLDDVLEGIKDSNLEAKDAEKAIASAFRHNFTNSTNFSEYIEDKNLRNKYTELAKLAFLKKPDSKKFIPAEELEGKELRQIRKMIENGHLGLFYGREEYKYLEYLAANDYEWLLKNIEKYDQENMLLSAKILRPTDQRRYAEKLLSQGDEMTLKMILNNNSFSNNSLSREIFWDLTKNGHPVEPRFFADLDGSSLQLFLTKFHSDDKSANTFYRNSAIFKNIEYFDLEQGFIENKEELLAYQKLLKSVKDLFSDIKNPGDIFSTLGLDCISNFKSAEEIRERQDNITSKLLIFKKVIGEKDLGRFFNNSVSVNILNQDIESLHEEADSLRYLLRCLAQTTAENLEILRGLTHTEKETAGKLLGLNCLPLNELILKIKQSSSLDKDLNDILLRDFAVDVTKLEVNDKSDFHKIISAISESWSKNYSEQTSGNNQIIYARDAALFGKKFPLDNDRFIRIARYYQAKGSFDKSLSEFNFNTLSDMLGSEFNQDNWAAALIAYISAMEEDRWQVPPDRKEELNMKFSGPYRDVCLESMSNKWRDFLMDEKKEELPLTLLTLSKTIDHYGGAGNLSRVEALAGLMNSFSAAMENKKVAPRTINEIKNLLFQEEKRFEKENWSQDDKAEFHNLAHELIEAAPSLFSAFAPIFEKLSAKEMRGFFKEMLPLYHINLITIQSPPDSNGNTSYEARDLIPVRSSIKRLATAMQGDSESRSQGLQLEKDRLTATMRANFRERMGLENVPKLIDKEGLRMLHNFIRYTGNISDRDSKKEAIISFFLALNINGDWEKFRKGDELDPENYLSENKAKHLTEVMKVRNSNKLTADMIGLNNSQLSDFQDKLQAETINSMIGNVETIDVKLEILKRNVDDLLDADAYEDKTEKSLLKILKKHRKVTGSSLAKIFKKLNGATITMSQDEELVTKELAAAFEIQDWSQDKVIEIQKRMQPISLIINMAKKLDESDLENKIKDLNKFLDPNEQVTAVFNKLDENFKTGSGAIAIGKDIEYLDSLLVKGRSRISEEEAAIASDYLNAIRERMTVLDTIMEGAKEYFNKIRASINVSNTNNNRLTSRLDDIETVINSNDTLIMSEMTKDFTLIIENMRQCLGCLRKEDNNDTNLAFGDYNKFFLVSKKEKTRKSVADQIVFLLPVTKEDGSDNMSFVMDRVYGRATSDTLLAHFLTVYKKFNSLKSNFKDAKLSISITHEALSSATVDSEIFKARILEKLPDANITFSDTKLTAEVPNSSFSDNYIEFGKSDSARSTGKREYQALLIE